MDVISLAENDINLALASMNKFIKDSSIKNVELLVIFHIYVLMVMRAGEIPLK